MENKCTYNDCLFVADLEELACILDDLSVQFNIIFKYIGYETDVSSRFSDLTTSLRDSLENYCKNCPLDLDN